MKYFIVLILAFISFPIFGQYANSIHVDEGISKDSVQMLLSINGRDHFTGKRKPLFNRGRKGHFENVSWNRMKSHLINKSKENLLSDGTFATYDSVTTLIAAGGGGGALPYDSYVATMLQSISQASGVPQVAALLDSLAGKTVTWFYTDPGQYYFTITGFDSNTDCDSVAVFVTIRDSFLSAKTFSAGCIDIGLDDGFLLTFQDENGLNAELEGHFVIEIRMY